LESEKLSVKFKQNRNLAITRMNIGDIHFWSGDNKKANSYYKLALEIIEYSSLQTKIFLYAGLCKTEAIMGNYDQAIIYGNQGLESAKKTSWN